MLFLRLCLIAVMVWFTASVSFALEVTLTTIAGKSDRGTLTALDRETISYLSQTTMQSSKINVKELASITLADAPAPPRETEFDRIELVDGSILVASKIALRGKLIVPTLLTHPTGAVSPAINLPLSAASSWRRNAHDAKVLAEWNKLLANRPKRDVVALRQGDGYNALSGSLLDANEAGDSVAFDQEDGTRLNLRLTRITGGVIFYQPQQGAIVPTLCRVVDLFGNTLVAANITLTERGADIITVSGAKVSYPSLDCLVKFDFAKGNILYLSDLSPNVQYAEARDTTVMGPEFGLALKITKDRGRGKQDIIINGKKYDKGLGIPAGAVVTFPLDGSFREFSFLPASLPRGDQAEVLLPIQIELDGRILHTIPSDAAAPKVETTLNIKDGKELRISVGTRFYMADRILLLDARLQK